MVDCPLLCLITQPNNKSPIGGVYSLNPFVSICVQFGVVYDWFRDIHTQNCVRMSVHVQHVQNLHMFFNRMCGCKCASFSCTDSLVLCTFNIFPSPSGTSHHRPNTYLCLQVQVSIGSLMGRYTMIIHDISMIYPASCGNCPCRKMFHASGLAALPK